MPSIHNRTAYPHAQPLLILNHPPPPPPHPHTRSHTPQAIGQLLLAVACAGLSPPGHNPSLELLSSGPGAARYSHELVRLLGALLAATEGGPLGSVRQLAAYPLLAERCLQELDGAHITQDNLVSVVGGSCRGWG